MSDREVCEIKPFLCFYLLFGYYHDLHPSHKIRLIAKLYCLLLFGLNTMTYYTYIGYFPWYMLTISYFEYASTVFHSLIFKNKYLINYYQYMPSVDGIPVSKKFISLRQVFRLVFPIVLILELILSELAYIIFGSKKTFDIIFYISIFFGTQLRRLPIMLIFMLFYYRVKIMLETLETNGFDNTPRRRFRPQKYIQMYETLMGTLKHADFYLKLKGSIFLTSSMLSLFFQLFMILSHNARNSVYVITRSITRTSLLYMIEFQFIIISAALSDLIRNNIKKMKIIVVEKRVHCNNERERAEIQKLCQLMQIRPYVYTLGGVFPLTMRSLLGFISYIITLVIAILQIQRLAF